MAARIMVPIVEFIAYTLLRVDTLSVYANMNLTFHQALGVIVTDDSMYNKFPEMNRGRLIVAGMFSGSGWISGGVCNIDQAASTVCAQTGYEWGKAVHFKQLSALFPIIATNIQCNGTAWGLGFCDVEFSSNGTCDVHGLNGIQCYNGRPPNIITILAVTCVAAILILFAGAVAIWYVVCKQQDVRPIPFHEFSDDDTRCPWSDDSEDDVSINSSTIT